MQFFRKKNEKKFHEISWKTGKILHKLLLKQKTRYEKEENAAAARMENRKDKHTENRRTSTKKA